MRLQVSTFYMAQNKATALDSFQNSVAVKFQLYNSLFLSLPFDRVEKTGILLSLFLSDCEEGFHQGRHTPQIVEEFLNAQSSIASEKEKIDLLLRFVQYAERQVVLFDALEDAAFPEVNDMDGPGTLEDLKSAVRQNKKQLELRRKLSDFKVRLVLTAHPTQFYPGSVLGIINDLTRAIAENAISDINTYLQQLGRTPFINKQKPTPFDEAVSLIWYLENVFYHAAGNIVFELNELAGDTITPVRLGFWPGGDRDGNPFVKVDTTLNVAAALRMALLRCYYRDLRLLKRRLTFAGVENIVSVVEQKLYQSIYTAGRDNVSLSKSDICDPLQEIRQILTQKHNGLFVHLVNDLIYKVELFGMFFASLDIRQESSVHGHILHAVAANCDALPSNYASQAYEEKIEHLLNVSQSVEPDSFDDEMVKDTLQTMAAMRTIQRQNGPEGCERYIISQCQSALNVVEVYGLMLLAGWRREEMSVDIVPLFETVSDLKNASGVMRKLYETPQYRSHLKNRADKQTIMLGFSDGTKDGGYLMANWSIYKAKDELTRLSKEFGIETVFFDGRGGPPARGGGKTHKFYSSMGQNISDKAIELTIQGQTVSSNFGTVDAAQFNIEQLLHAGIYDHISKVRENTFSADEETLMQQLADESFRSYEELKNHPTFLEYLLHASPLRFYSETNIGSRPAKRGGSSKLELKDLRAIPFVGAWSQLKQNVPGFYGVGTALRTIEANGNLADVKEIYRNNEFFKALIDNCEMAMVKSFFPLTDFLSGDPVYGDIWRKIYKEYELTRNYLLLISGKDALMSDYPVERQSIEMRERIMLPLTTIQQYALAKTRDLEEGRSEMKDAYEKLIMRCSFGIINAGRNSA